MSAGSILVISLSVTSTFAAGLACDLSAVREALRTRAIWAALVGNLVVVPVCALLVLPTSGPRSLGVLLVAAAPGGGIGPLLVLLGRGDAALASALFLLLSLAGTVIALALTLVLEIEVVDMLRATTLVAASAIAPLIVGIAVNRRAPDRSSALLPWISRLGALLLVTTVLWFAIEHANGLTASTLAAAGFLAATSACVGWLASRWLGMTRAATIAIVEISLVRNVALALVVVTGLGGEPAAIMSVLSYALVMLVAGGALAVVSARVRELP